VLVAAIFLAVIGASVGFLLGVRDNGDEGSGGPDPGQVSVEESDPDAEPPPPPPPPADGESHTTERPEEEAPPTGDDCPQHTRRLARQAGSPGELTLKLYIRTAKSQAWICTDSDDKLFYQGLVGKPGDRPREGDNALFLLEVVEEDGIYRAENKASDGGGTTTYVVSPETLITEFPNGSKTTDQVVDHRP
jgi:hypothetical protein